MSYPILSPKDYTFKQMGLIATARSEPGIHILYPNGFTHEQEGDRGQVIFPKGLSKSVKWMHVINFPDDKKMKEYRIFYEGGKEEKHYVDYTVDGPGYGRNLGFYQNDPSNNSEYVYKDSGLIKEKDFKYGVSVIQLDVDQSNGIMVKWNGQDMWSKRANLTLDISKLTYHQFGMAAEHTVFNATLLEIHVTYKGDASGDVFNHGQDFTALKYVDEGTVIMLSPGALLIWEGKAETDDEITIKDNGVQLFSHKGKTDSLRVITKVMRGQIVTGEAGKPPTLVTSTRYDIPASGSTNYLAVEVNKHFKLTNCVVVTGILGAP
ncbi:uncharacterized protein LOC135377152 [Ornithodoros turicata]|uniref:uncharacterized protein LOC135377152 n=1 Tax=Ornithodoros turicata TaxID=34597 RepID=UPI0031388ED7